MTHDRLPPGAAALLARIERDELSAADKRILLRAMRAAIDGRPVAEILNAEARKRRDDALRAMAGHFSGAPSGAAKAMAAVLRRYRARGEPPAVGTLARACHDVLACGDAPSWRTILRALPRHPLSVAKGSTPKPTPEAP